MLSAADGLFATRCDQSIRAFRHARYRKLSAQEQLLARNSNMDIFEPQSNQSATAGTADKFKSGNGTRLIPDTILRNSSNNNSQSSKGRNTDTLGSK